MVTGPIDQLAEAAEGFRRWVEDGPGDHVQSMHELRVHLACLHLAALRLPADCDADGPDPPSQDVERSKQVRAGLGWLPFNHYREIFDPFEIEEPLTGSLVDDLADIYGDLMQGLWLHEHGHREAAAWQWRFSFDAHWGEHLTSAQRAVYWWFNRTRAF